MADLSAAGGGGGGASSSSSSSVNKNLITDKFVLVFDLDNTLIDTTDDLMRSAELLMPNISDPAFQTVQKEELYRKIDPLVNSKLFTEVLKPAVELRSQKIDAIILLTNNLSTNYASAISMYMYDLFNSEGQFETIRADPVKGDPRITGPPVKHFFDYIMVRDHISRPKSSYPPYSPKRLVDVKLMLHYLGKPTINLARRLFFFDDYINTVTLRKHDILQDMSSYHSSNHYIIVKGSGPYLSGGYTKGAKNRTDYSVVKDAFENGVPLKNPTPIPPVRRYASVPTATATTPSVPYVYHEPTEEEKEEDRRLKEQEEQARAFMAQSTTSSATAKSKRTGLSSLFAPTVPGPIATKGGFIKKYKGYKGYKKSRRTSKYSKARKTKKRCRK